MRKAIHELNDRRPLTAPILLGPRREHLRVIRARRLIHRGDARRLLHVESDTVLDALVVVLCGPHRHLGLRRWQTNVVATVQRLLRQRRKRRPCLDGRGLEHPPIPAFVQHRAELGVLLLRCSYIDAPSLVCQLFDVGRAAVVGSANARCGVASAQR